MRKGIQEKNLMLLSSKFNQYVFEIWKYKSSRFDKVLICGTQLSIIAPLLDLYSSMTVKDRLQLMKDYWYPKLVENKKVSLIKILKHKIKKISIPLIQSMQMYSNF